MDSGTFLRNLENVWKLLQVLSKSWSRFVFSIRSYIKNISKYKVQFSDHIYTNFLDFFHVHHRYKYQTEVWKKLQFLTNYCCLDNDDPISFFVILLRTQIFVYKDFSSNFFTKVFNRQTDGPTDQQLDSVLGAAIIFFNRKEEEKRKKKERKNGWPPDQ